MTESFEKELKKIDYDLLISALRDDQFDLFRQEFMDLHSYEQAKFFSKLEGDYRSKIYEYLSPEETATLFENLELEDEQYEEILSEMNPSYAADMLAQMYADDAVDVLNELDKEQVATYLTIMDDEAADEIKELLHYEEYTAGSIMTTEFVAIAENQTVRSAMHILRSKAPEAEIIYYVYVIDDDKKLTGVISLRDLIISDDDTMISEIMNERVMSVSVSDDQEEVARTMKDYNFLAVPVVDFQKHLLGIITVDDIIDVMDEEATDDYSKLAGVSDIDRIDMNPFVAAKKRLPWLVILLFLGMLTASLISHFEAALNQKAILAIFIPLIGGMAGNSGTQALAIAVRGIATGDLEQDKWKLVLREACTGFITGATCCIVIALVIFLWHGDFVLGCLVGVSILATIIVATLAGSLVPLFMHKMNIDPAVASGPFITTISDIISILIYFTMATLFMGYLI